MASAQISKKRKASCFFPIFSAVSGTNRKGSRTGVFVADGVFYAELNEFFQRELAAEGYSGVEVRVTPARTEIII
ncbi:40S ribosomal protein S3, partial [Linnemannia elongata]